MKKTITKAEMKRREKLNKATGMHDTEIDRHNKTGQPCERCGKDKTRGHCFEDSDLARICNTCWWTRTDRLKPADLTA